MSRTSNPERNDRNATSISAARMRTNEAAAYMGISNSTLAKGRITGNSPPYSKVGRIVVYDRRDIDEWLAARRRRSTSDEPAS